MGSTNSQFTLQNCLGIAAPIRLQLRSPSAGRTSPNTARSRRQHTTTATSAPCPCALQTGLWALRGCFPGLRPFPEGGRLLPHPLPPAGSAAHGHPGGHGGTPGVPRCRSPGPAPLPPALTAALPADQHLRTPPRGGRGGPSAGPAQQQPPPSPARPQP